MDEREYERDHGITQEVIGDAEAMGKGEPDVQDADTVV